MADFSDGMGRFAVGLGKKVLLANLCGKMVEQLLPAGGQLSVAGAWLSAIMYMLQIYFDFFRLLGHGDWTWPRDGLYL